jgi:putative transcriptional regulator
LPADTDIIFTLPVEQRVQAATRKLGFDFSLISTQAGHA